MTNPPRIDRWAVVVCVDDRRDRRKRRSVRNRVGGVVYGYPYIVLGLSTDGRFIQVGVGWYGADRFRPLKPDEECRMPDGVTYLKVDE